MTHPVENDAHCEHAHVKTFRSYPPRSVCQDCGRDVKLSWCDPAAEPAARAPIPPGWNPIPPEGGYTKEDS